MGNCQVTEAATMVIQHPGGRVERLYWPMSASEVMKNNPGHYVALVTLSVPEEKHDGGGTVRSTRVRLLKPRDTLLLGQVYRLITSQEVMKAIEARKNEKMKKRQAELIGRQQQSRLDDQGVQVVNDGREKDSENTDQVAKQERDQHKTSKQSAGRARHWRPSLQSIAEIGN